MATPVSRLCTLIALLALPCLILGQQRYLHVASLATDVAHLKQIAPDRNPYYDPPTVNSLRNGYSLWAKFVNNNGGINIQGQNYLINLTEHFIGDASTPALTNYALQVVDEVGSGARGPVDVVFGPFGSGLTNVTMIALEKWGKLMIASSSTSSANFICSQATLAIQPPCQRHGDRRFKYLWAVSSIASNALKTSTQFLSVRPDVKTFAAWSENFPYLHELVDASLDVARSNKHTILNKITIPYKPNREQVLAVAKEMQRLNADVVVSGNDVESCEYFVEALNEINYLPKALLMPNCIDFPSVGAKLGNLSNYIMGMALWDKRLTGVNYEDTRFFPSTPTEGSSMRFFNAYVNEFNTDPTIYSALGFQVGETLQELIAKTDVIDTEVWNSAMATLQFNTFFGYVQFNGYHQNIGLRELTLQQINGKPEIVDPLSAATSSFVYPMPSWEDRVFTSTYLGKPMELGIAAVSIILAMMLLTGAAIVVVRRKAPVITAASPVFCLLIILGSLLPIVGIFSWMLHTHTVLCHLRIWLLNLGFSFVYGAIFTKTWRVLKIFMDKSLAARNVSLKEIATIESAIVGFDIVLCALWSGIARPVAEKITVSPLLETHNYIECVATDPTADFAFFIVAAVTKGIFMIVGIVITFKVRKVKYLLFNEAKWIGYSVYNLFVFLIVLVPLQFMETERSTLFFIRSLFILIIVLATNLLIFGPKFWILFGPQKGGTILMSTIQAGSDVLTVAEGGAMGQTVVDEKGDEKLEKLNDQIADLKKKIKRQQKKIGELEEQLAQERAQNHENSDLPSESEQTETEKVNSEGDEESSVPLPPLKQGKSSHRRDDSDTQG